MLILREQYPLRYIILIILTMFPVLIKAKISSGKLLLTGKNIYFSLIYEIAYPNNPIIQQTLYSTIW